MTTYDITILGNAPVDVLYPGIPEDMLAAFGLTKGDFHSLETGQAQALHAALGEGRLASGGAGANTAHALGKLGHRVAFVGYVGADRFGLHFHHDMQDAGVHMPAPVEGQPTMRLNVLITDDGERTFATNGAGKTFVAEELPAEALAHTRMLMLDGYLLDKERHHAAIHHALATARANGAAIALPLASPSMVNNRFGHFHAIIMEGVDLLIGNDSEYEALEHQIHALPTEAAAAMRDKLRATCRLHTHGKDGATFHAPSHRGDPITLHEPSLPAARIVDATGAGDNFLAGFLDGYLRGAPYRTALRQGHALAAQAIRQVGARLPNLSRKLLETPTR